jgi:hypothetical protein
MDIEDLMSNTKDQYANVIRKNAKNFTAVQEKIEVLRGLIWSPPCGPDFGN